MQQGQDMIISMYLVNAYHLGEVKDFIKEQARDSDIFGIGETGLDSQTKTALNAHRWMSQKGSVYYKLCTPALDYLLAIKVKTILKN